MCSYWLRRALLVFIVSALTLGVTQPVTNESSQAISKTQLTRRDGDGPKDHSNPQGPHGDAEPSPKATPTTDPTPDPTRSSKMPEYIVIGVLSAIMLIQWVLLFNLCRTTCDQVSRGSNDYNSHSDYEQYKLQRNLPDPQLQPRDTITKENTQDTLSMDLCPKLDPRDFRRIRKLGQGSTGSVHSAYYRSPANFRLTAAVKKASNPHEVNKLRLELLIMSQLDCDYIVRLFGYVEQASNVWIVMEYADRGNLLSYLKSEAGQKMPLLLMHQFAYCTASGLEYIHNQGVLHRDVSARNVLVTADHIPLIADFGRARFMNEEGIYYSQRGGRVPAAWTDPQAARTGQYTRSTDVWAFAVLLFELYSGGEKPYGRIKSSEVWDQVEAGLRLDQPANCPPNVFGIMFESWSRDEASRPTLCDYMETLLVLINNDGAEPLGQNSVLDLNTVVPSSNDDSTHKRFVPELGACPEEQQRQSDKRSSSATRRDSGHDYVQLISMADPDLLSRPVSPAVDNAATDQSRTSPSRANMTDVDILQDIVDMDQAGSDTEQTNVAGEFTDNDAFDEHGFGRLEVRSRSSQSGRARSPLPRFDELLRQSRSRSQYSLEARSNASGYSLPSGPSSRGSSYSIYEDFKKLSRGHSTVSSARPSRDFDSGEMRPRALTADAKLRPMIRPNRNDPRRADQQGQASTAGKVRGPPGASGLGPRAQSSGHLTVHRAGRAPSPLATVSGRSSSDSNSSGHQLMASTMRASSTQALVGSSRSGSERSSVEAVSATASSRSSAAFRFDSGNRAHSMNALHEPSSRERSTGQRPGPRLDPVASLQSKAAKKPSPLSRDQSTDVLHSLSNRQRSNHSSILSPDRASAASIASSSFGGASPVAAEPLLDKATECGTSAPPSSEPSTAHDQAVRQFETTDSASQSQQGKHQEASTPSAPPGSSEAFTESDLTSANTEEAHQMGDHDPATVFSDSGRTSSSSASLDLERCPVDASASGSECATIVEIGASTGRENRDDVFDAPSDEHDHSETRSFNPPSHVKLTSVSSVKSFDSGLTPGSPCQASPMDTGSGRNTEGAGGLRHESTV